MLPEPFLVPTNSYLPLMSRRSTVEPGPPVQRFGGFVAKYDLVSNFCTNVRKTAAKLPELDEAIVLAAYIPESGEHGYRDEEKDRGDNHRMVGHRAPGPWPWPIEKPQPDGAGAKFCRLMDAPIQAECAARVNAP
jgi:hypothetical protein